MWFPFSFAGPSQSVADMLRTPLDFESTVLETGLGTVTRTRGRSGVYVGKYPVLDHAAHFAQQNMQALEEPTRRALPTRMHHGPYHIRQEGDYYLSLDVCIFASVTSAMEELGVNATCNTLPSAGEACYLHSCFGT